MKKIIFFGWYIPSTFNTIIPVLEELLNNNIEIHYFGFKEFKDEIKNLGIKYYECMPLEEAILRIQYNNVNKEDIVTKSLVGMDRLIDLFKIYKDSALNDVKKINPDIIFRDNDAIHGLFIARELNIKSIGINCMPYISEKYIKSNTIRNYIAYLGEDLKKADDIQEGFYEEIEDNLKIICKEKRVPYINPTYLVSGCDDINICFGSKSINKIIGDENKVKVVKPVFKDVVELNEEFDEELEDMLSSPKPLIYMASGLMINYKDEYYNYVINAVIEINYNLIISIPSMESYNNDLPSNIIIRNTVPQQRILEKASLFLTTGGYNSICEAIQFEAPMIINPMRFDQPLNALIIEELGIGVNVRNTNLNSEVVKSSIDNIINDEKYKNSIRIVKKECKSMERLRDVVKDLTSV